MAPYVCCRQDDFEALIFRCEAIKTTSFKGQKTAVVSCCILIFPNPRTNKQFILWTKIKEIPPYVCCRRDDFEALIFRCEAIETTSFNGGKTADVKVSHFQFWTTL